MLTSIRSKVCVKTESTQASLQLKGQVQIQNCKLSYYEYISEDNKKCMFFFLNYE